MFYFINEFKESFKLIEILNGANNSFMEIVALNAAAGLIVAGLENNLRKAYFKSRNYLLSGKAINKLKELI